MEFYIYCIVNLNTEKLYIGKTNNPEVRWKDHQVVANGGKEKYPIKFQYLHYSIAILEVYQDEISAFEAERYWISYLRDLGIGLYNLTEGGEGASGVIRSAETRAKLSASHKGLQAGDKHPLWGKEHSKKSKKLMSISHKKRVQKPGYKNPFEGMSYMSGKYGDNAANTKVSDADMVEMRKMIDSGKYLLREIADKYNISISMVSMVKTGKRRKRVQ